MPDLEKTILIEDVVNIPGAVGFLIRKGIPCIVCGEPIWGTLEDLARGHGKTSAELDALVAELNNDISHQAHNGD